MTGFALLSGLANSSQPTTCKLKLITAQTLVSSHARTWQRVLIYSCRLRLLFPFMLLSVVISLGLVVQRSSNRVGLSSAKLLEACNQRPINYKYYQYIRYIKIMKQNASNLLRKKSQRITSKKRYNEDEGFEINSQSYTAGFPMTKDYIRCLDT